MSGIYRGYFYLTTLDPNPQLMATYNEAIARQDPDDPTYGWFQPYPDLDDFDPGSAGAIDGTPISVPADGNGTTYYKVDLKTDYLTQHGISPLAPGNPVKDPFIYDTSWQPYVSSNMFYEQVKAFPAASPIADAITSIEQVRDSGDGLVKQAFDALAAAQNEPTETGREALVMEAYDKLRAVVLDDPDNNSSPMSEIAATMPDTPDVPQPPPAFGGLDQGLSDANAVWRYYMLCALVLHIHQS